MASHIMQAPELFSSRLTLSLDFLKNQDPATSFFWARESRLDMPSYEGTCAVALLPCLLSRAHGLKFLSLRLQCTFWIPELTHLQSTLQHLQIDSTGGTLSQLEPLLPKLQGLRTLCLKSDGWQPQCDRTKLRLQILTQLQSIQLDDVIPASLTLAKGTALHVRCSSRETALSEMWSTLTASEAMRSFTLRAFGLDVPAQSIPRFLLVANDLESVFFHCRNFGPGTTVCTFSQEVPVVLQGPWLRLRRLSLLAEQHVSIVVDAGPINWQVLNISCSLVLTLRFADVGAFAEKCPEISFTYRRLNCPDTEALVALLGNKGVHFEMKQDDRGSRNMSTSTRRWSTTNQLHSIDNRFKFDDCCCGACWKCCPVDKDLMD